MQNAAVASVLSPWEEKDISLNGSTILYHLRVSGPTFITQEQPLDLDLDLMSRHLWATSSFVSDAGSAAMTSPHINCSWKINNASKHVQIFPHLTHVLVIMHILSPGDTIENADFETWVTFKNVITYYKVMMFSIEGVYKIKQCFFKKKKETLRKQTEEVD